MPCCARDCLLNSLSLHYHALACQQSDSCAHSHPQPAQNARGGVKGGEGADRRYCPPGFTWGLRGGSRVRHATGHVPA
eukprot:3753412-Rhodomonas_salina.1